MRYLFTPAGSRSIDLDCNAAGITPLTLMTTAAQSATNILLDRFPSGKRILIVCGQGNNGGDGFAMAHMLAPFHTVEICTTADPARLSEEARYHYGLVHQRQLTVTSGSIENHPFDIVIDALIGVGGSHALRDPLPVQLRWMNSIRAFKVAIDVPTGLNAETGEAHADVFQADLTITMEGPKTGFYRMGGRQCVGEIAIARIGAPAEIVERHAAARSLETSDIRRWLPIRAANTSKFDYGRVLVVAGSQSMRGAAALTSEAAIRMGAGLVVLATPSVHPLVLREVMTEVLPMHTDGTISVEARPLIEQQVARATVVAVGPGLGTNPDTLRMLADVLNRIDPQVPIVIDADGLRMLPFLDRDLTNVIMTPHGGELARLKSLLNTEHLSRYLEQGTWHIKGVPSVTTHHREVFWTVNGNAGMATAGTGDVLTGMIAGLLAQGLPPVRATALGAFLHASAGDWCAEHQPMETMIAGDLIKALPHVLPA